MRIVLDSIYKCFGRKRVELEVEEELCFHIELLTQEHIEQGMTPEEAKDATRKRFGDIERFKNQCVEISGRNHPLMRAMNSFLIFIFLSGVFARILSADSYIGQVGNMLMVVAALSWLLLYTRSLNPSSFLSKSGTSSPLTLNTDSQSPVAAYHGTTRTPVERLISDE